MNTWQACPICSGVGQVSGGYFSRAGDFPYWMACKTNLEACRICKGLGIISKETGFPPEEVAKKEAK